MQTVNFQCGHCHKVMGVSSAFLGKQVRCPHCQQVVMAPAQAPAPAAAPRPGSAPNFPSGPPGRDEHESIFGEHVDEDLFGGGRKAQVELPPEPPKPQSLQLEPTLFNVPGLPEMADPTAPGLGGGNTGAAVAERRIQAAPSGPAPGDWNGGAPGTESAPAATLRPAARSSAGGNMVMVYVLIGISAYALLMTLLTVKYYFAYNSAPKPMEMLPDMGDPKSKSSSQIFRRIVPTTELPPSLVTELGKPIQIGDLEVIPQKVEQKRVKFCNRNAPPTSATADNRPEEEALVLFLDFKNISKGTMFRPTDSAFDYAWRDRTDSESVMPYTFLTVNGIRYCGPFRRITKEDRFYSRGGDNLRIDYIEGQEQDKKILKPGETASTVIVTEPKDQVPSLLRTQKGKLLWRVQLRRGLVKVEDKELSATCVIGVEFDKDQVQKVDK